MKHVRLPLMSREFLMTHVDSESLVRENAECKELLLEAMRYHLLPGVVTDAILSFFYFKVVDGPGSYHMDPNPVLHREKQK